MHILITRVAITFLIYDINNILIIISRLIKFYQLETCRQKIVGEQFTKQIGVLNYNVFTLKSSTSFNIRVYSVNVDLGSDELRSVNERLANSFHGKSGDWFAVCVHSIVELKSKNTSISSLFLYSCKNKTCRLRLITVTI